MVLHKGGCQNVGSYFFKALALADNLFLAVYMSGEINYLICTYMSQTGVIDITYNYLWPIIHTFNVGIFWMVVLVAGNRYVAICHPLVASRLST